MKTPNKNFSIRYLCIFAQILTIFQGDALPSPSASSISLLRNQKNTIQNENPIQYTQEIVEFNNERELWTLKCPASSIGQEGEQTNNDNVEAHRYSIYSKGELGTKFIHTIRGKSSQFYQDILDTAIMAFCDLSLPEVTNRCVDVNSTMAAKDWNGECIQTLDFTCPENTCERTSNCYWKKAIPNQVRENRFPVEEYSKARQKLVGGFSGQQDLMRALTNSEERSYVFNLLTPAVVGIILSVILLFLWFIYFIGRTLCCCIWRNADGDSGSSLCFICSPIPKKSGYKIILELLLPTLFLIFSILAIVVASTIAFIGNKDIDLSLTNTFLHSSNMMDDLSQFLGRSKLPLTNINTIVQEAALDAKTIFDDTGYVTSTLSLILSAFVDFGFLHSSALEKSNTRTFFDEAYQSLNLQVTPIVDEVQFMLDTLELDLYDKVDTIETSLGSAIEQVDSISNVTEEYKTKIYEIEGIEFSMRQQRQAGVLVLFLISLFFSLLGFVGILISKITGKNKFLYLLNLTGFLNPFLGSASLIFASIALSLNIFYYDLCQLSQIVTQDFEPLVGEKVAPGANACFNNTNLAVAFNVSDKVDFQAKLDQSLSILSDTNVTEQFSAVISPLEEVQHYVESITTTALDVLNQGTNINSASCPFNDVYTKDTILEPWTLHLLSDQTDWIVKETGTVASYDRDMDVGGSGLPETPFQYMDRIYDAAGQCFQSTSCCLNNVCGLNPGETCNGGTDCVYPCEQLSTLINVGYVGYMQAYDMENKMSSDLGVVCPNVNGITCPTLDFQTLGHSYTLLGLISDYEQNVTGTTDDLIQLGYTSVGDTMDEIKDFLCNMNVSFVERRYDQVVKEDICEMMFGGIAQIHWGLWILAFFLQLNAVLCNMLSTRFRGLTRKQAKMEDEFGQRSVRSISL